MGERCLFALTPGRDCHPIKLKCASPSTALTAGTSTFSTLTATAGVRASAAS